jgi:hypothetical protein
MAWVDLAAALNRTGEVRVAPDDGEHTVTPIVLALQSEGDGVGVGIAAELVKASLMGFAVAAAPG